ncbi:exonuclease SbcCD subunit D [Bacillus sp. FJAT-44742]|uniref:exonuclease SbcCD subunit D n=1 Tax=Bacillus sp. FJAT-44742 TaxID=2014005 RepID=UPI000C23C613|nr:exonuclease SbcCD subunit D [Bacillus sp. FJAT-44742]
MRLLHTADWHLGRTLEGRDRLAEHEQFFDELALIVEEEKVDAILMAGDVFDSVNPPAAAEQLFYESMARLSNKGKRPVAIIAGNHDHPERLSAARTLAKEQAISIIGYPTKETTYLEVPSCGERLHLASLPYPSESRLKESFVEEGEEETLREAYDYRIKQIFGELTKTFEPKDVNIAMSHIFVAGGSATDSERPIEVGGAYTIRATSLPENVQYTALGHLHRPQNVNRAPGKARYAGSPLAFSFSEAGYSKSVTIIDAEPGGEAIVKEVHLSCGKPLVRWRAKEGLSQVHQWMSEKRDTQSWIDLEVHLEHTPSMEEIHRLRKEYPGIVTIRPIFPEQKATNEQKRDQVPIDQLFYKFYERQTGGAQPEEDLVRLFLELVNEEEEVTS